MTSPSPPPPPPSAPPPPPPHAERARLKAAAVTSAAPSFLRILAIVGRSFRVFTSARSPGSVGGPKGIPVSLQAGEADGVDNLPREREEQDQDGQRCDQDSGHQSGPVRTTLRGLRSKHPDRHGQYPHVLTAADQEGPEVLIPHVDEGQDEQRDEGRHTHRQHDLEENPPV